MLPGGRQKEFFTYLVAPEENSNVFSVSAISLIAIF
jgi:hypothetical protein